MLTTYFTRPTTRAQYYASPAGPYLDAFTEWLAQCGYRQESIRPRQTHYNPCKKKGLG